MSTSHSIHSDRLRLFLLPFFPFVFVVDGMQNVNQCQATNVQLFHSTASRHYRNRTHAHSEQRQTTTAKKRCILNQFYLYYDKLFCKTNPANKLSYFPCALGDVCTRIRVLCAAKTENEQIQEVRGGGTQRPSKRERDPLCLWQCEWMDECTSMATNKTKRKYSTRNGAQPQHHGQTIEQSEQKTVVNFCWKKLQIKRGHPNERSDDQLENDILN